MTTTTDQHETVREAATNLAVAMDAADTVRGTIDWRNATREDQQMEAAAEQKKWDAARELDNAVGIRGFCDDNVRAIHYLLGYPFGYLGVEPPAAPKDRANNAVEEIVEMARRDREVRIEEGYGLDDLV